MLINIQSLLSQILVLEWAKQMGGTESDFGRAIAVDASGNVYTIGTFQETVDFDPGADTVNLTSVGGYDIYIQKLDSNGNFIWAKQIGGSRLDEGTSIAIDASMNIYITGYFYKTADFDPGEGVVKLTSFGDYDIFVEKLDSAGDFLWVRQMGGQEDDIAESIAVDASGNIYTTGDFAGTADFDLYEGETNLTSAGLTDIYVQKLYPCYPTDPVPDVPNLPDLSAVCEITATAMDAPVPTATSNCVGTITATTDLTFPITDQSVTQIVWTYDDKNGNVITQNQAINWTPMDVSVSLNGDTITVNNGNGTYQWLDCDNNAPLSGENNQSFIAPSSGNYAVEITEEGCVDTSECNSIIISSLMELDNNENLIVYPNPSSNKFSPI